MRGTPSVGAGGRLVAGALATWESANNAQIAAQDYIKELCKPHRKAALITTLHCRRRFAVQDLG